MTTEKDELLKSQEEVIDSKLGILDERTSMFGEAVYRDARNRLLVRVGSIVTLVTVVAGLGGFAWMNSIADNVDELTKTLEVAEKDLAAIEETNKELIGGRLDEVFGFVLGAMTSNSMYCTDSEPPSSEKLATLRLEFTSDYSVGGDLETARSFGLPHPGRALDVHVDPDVIPFGEIGCLRLRGAISLTNDETPAYRDLRDLPSLAGFAVSQTVIERSDGELGNPDQIREFREFWRRVGPVSILVEIGRTNLFFVRNPDFFVAEEWFDGDETLIALNPVEFVEHTYPSGTKVERAFFPIREPVFLSQLIK